ncbi:MAG: mechanosensitive ion channel family protein [Actinomycetota bacterium]|nr:mechanosensitive ion channel family protein [Actinomycetota bacterium]
MAILRDKTFLLSLSFILGSLLIGIIVEKLASKLLSRLEKHSEWRGYVVVRSSLRFMITLWFLIGGIYGALSSMSLSAQVVSIYNKVLISLVVLSCTVVAARILAGIVDAYTRRKPEEGTLGRTTILGNIIKVFVILVGILFLFALLGIPIAPILTALGVGGLAVALAFQDTLSNLFAGIHVLAARQVKPGEYVRLESGDEGYIEDMNWRNTTIRTLSGNMVIIPNNKLGSGILTNYHRPATRMSLLVDVPVSYTTDLEKAERIALETAFEVQREVEGGELDFKPLVRFQRFSDFNIVMTAIIGVREFSDQYLVKHEFIKRLHQRFKEEGVGTTIPAFGIFER